jgi:membrane-associated phospholipid phosphatase
LLNSRILLGLFLAFLFFSPVSGQEWKSPDADTSIGHFPVKLVDDLPHFFINENIAPFAVGSVATALDWATLDNQDSLAGDLQQWNTQPLWDFGDFYGEGWIEGGLGLSGWGIGALTDDTRLQEFGRDTVEALALDGVVALSFKVTVQRQRPSGGNTFSFPSGHSITAFCFDPVVTKYWGWEAGVGAYLLGTIDGLARVEGRYHYLSDVFAGATLGILIGNAVTYTPKDMSLSVVPGGAEISWKF